MAWQGKDRAVFLGPAAQAVLKAYEKRDSDAPLFSPKEAVEQLHRERGERRVTKFYPSRQGWQKRQPHPSIAGGGSKSKRTHPIGAKADRGAGQTY